MASSALPPSDVLIAGAGIIGLALALELSGRGARVTVLERDAALTHASTAAAGMLAAHDPANPPELLPLSIYSLELYPQFLARIRFLSKVQVPFQTSTTIQHREAGSSDRLAEHSLDPRQLAAALRAAVRATSIQLHEDTGDLAVIDMPGGVEVRTTSGADFRAQHLVHATGTWFRGSAVVTPRKGQMLRVQLPSSLPLTEVHRSERVYIVPRTAGPQAGSALIGATIEDAGFDTTTHIADLNALRGLAAEWFPGMADERASPMLDAWAGLRPYTADGLPLLGALADSPHQFCATGHFRNGILLAPATAAVMADLLEGRPPAVSLDAFSPKRFGV